jgi:hypothetical protein
MKRRVPQVAAEFHDAALAMARQLKAALVVEFHKARLAQCIDGFDGVRRDAAQAEHARVEQQVDLVWRERGCMHWTSFDGG